MALPEASPLRLLQRLSLFVEIQWALEAPLSDTLSKERQLGL